ncbi:MAG: haloacid dehalogenase-like hydrolase [Bdellovibrionaceae bacterium]|nr:haloacid dehalogenase-like hydrolase [Pseudobdellovibrionaceae bacterium]
MKYKSYPETFWKQLNETLAELKKNQTPLVALFDADGTLWDTDLGENLFHYTIDNRLVELPPNPWEHYLELKKKNSDPRDAYLWLAQIYKGQTLDQVRKWADDALKSLQPFPVFDDQRKLINLLKNHQVTIKVITASIAWAVEPGARALGLLDSDVIGVETRVQNGIVTDEKAGVITYRGGKVEGYKAKHKDQPFLAVGNSEGDVELLEFSSHLRLAVSAANREDRLYKSEYHLQEIAKSKNWHFHRFI